MSGRPGARFLSSSSRRLCFEAGLRTKSTGYNPFPEEMSRRQTWQNCHFRILPDIARRGAESQLSEGVTDHV